MPFRGIIVLCLCLNKIWSGHCMRLKQKSCTLANWSAMFFRQLIRDPRNEFWHDPVYLVGLSVYSNIYLKVEDYGTENKINLHFEYEREKMVVAGISASSYYQVLQRMIVGLACLLSAALFIFGKWCCSDQFNLFVNGRFTECFHFPVLQYDGIPTHGSIVVCSLAMTLVKLRLLFRNVLSVEFVTLSQILGGALCSELPCSYSSTEITVSNNVLLFFTQSDNVTIRSKIQGEDRSWRLVLRQSIWALASACVY